MAYTVVTGANGYIAKHILKSLLEDGHRVIGTVRNSKKAEELKRTVNDENLIVELVPDMLVENAFDELFKKYNTQIKYVFHTASPVLETSKDYEKSLIEPAITGAKSMVEAIRKYSLTSVEHIVYTSSIAASSLESEFTDPTLVVSEDSWNPQGLEEAKTEFFTAYSYSKKIAEKTMWDFVEEYRGTEHEIKLTTVNPCFNIGPQAYEADVTETMNFTAELINHVVKSKVGDPLPPTRIVPYVDVRNTARAHVDALKNEKLAFQRLLVVGPFLSSQQIYDIVNERFPQLRGKIARGEPGSDKLDPAKLAKFDHARTTQALGWEFTPIEKAIADEVDQILRVGAYRG